MIPHHMHTQKKSMKEAELTTNKPRFGVFSLLQGLLPSVFWLFMYMNKYVMTQVPDYVYTYGPCYVLLLNSVMV